MKKSSYRPLRRSRTLRRKTLRRKTMRGGAVRPIPFLDGGTRYVPGGLGGRKRRTMRGGYRVLPLGGRKRRTMR